MTTEAPRTNHIKSYLEEAARILSEISPEHINNFINVLFEAWKRRNFIYIIGNGGSASTSIHFAADLNNVTRKFEEFNPHLPRFKAISFNENPSRNSALINDEGWDRVYTEQLKNFFGPGDVVIAISVHGGSGSDRAGTWSQNLPNALQYAKDHGGKTLGFTGFDGGIMKSICDVNVNIPANSTPHVEGLHVVFQHLVFQELQERIGNYVKEK